MKYFLGTLSCILMVMFFGITANAVTFDNDGKAKDNPYGDAKFKKSIEADYYDCYVPYNLTPADIGGWCTGTTAIGGHASYNTEPMKEEAKNRKISAFSNYQSNYVGNRHGSTKHSYDDIGMSVYTDANGNEYYATAIQNFFYSNSSAGEGYPGWSSANRGQLFDVVLTDGTVIHFMVGDANATQHTNAGGDDSSATFDIAYSYSEAILPQYNHLYQVAHNNCLELWGQQGCQSKFSEKFNIGNGDDQNRIAYYRMYNTFIKDNPKRAEGFGKGTTDSLGDVTIGDSQNDNVDSTGNEIISEWDLVGMEGLKTRIDDNALKDYTLPDRSNLSIGEAYSVESVKEDIAINKTALSYDNARVGVVFVGLLLILYSVFMFLGLVFDKVNTFIDISMVGILTFGVLKFSDDDFTKGEEGYVSTNRVIVISIVVMVVGLLLVSGGVLPFLMELVYDVTNEFM